MSTYQEAIRREHESARIHLDRAVQLIENKNTYWPGKLIVKVQHEITTAVKYLERASELV